MSSTFRLSGDGMDHDSVITPKVQPAKKPVSAAIPVSVKPQVVTLSSSSSSGNFVPYEPIKGAISSELSSPTAFKTSQHRINRSASKEKREKAQQKPLIKSDSQVIEKFDTSITETVSDRLDVNIDEPEPRVTGDIAKHATTVESTVPQPAAGLLRGSIVDREVEGQSSPDVERLQRELASVRAKLDQQTKVNADLKKLLVASVGDDLECKVESLVQTKVHLANEIGTYSKQMCDDLESLDQLTIQADMFRSKYSASRVLAAELAASLESRHRQLEHSRGVIWKLLQELQRLRYHTAQDRPSEAEVEALKIVNSGVEEVALPSSVAVATVAAAAGGGSKHGVYMRFHPSTQYEGFTVMCCNRCKGEILTV